MKKLLFLLSLPLCVAAQSSTGQETPFDYGIKIETGAIQTVTNPVYPATMGTDGTIGRALAKDLPIDISPQPTNYTIPDTKLGSHLKGIDVRLGEIGQPTAGVTNRIYLTGVPTTITAGTFFTSSAIGKGAVAGVLQTVSNDDNVKNYFGQDVISIAQPSATTAPPGNYSGQLSVMVDSNSAQERFTIEIYKTNNAGTPIASGITGAPVGDLGVTVVAILDSGVLDLVASAVSNVTVSGNLASTLSLATGERLRYHVSAQKVGTSGNAFMFSLFYGSDYNSYYDVPVTTTTDGVINKSTVSGLTTTNALDALNTEKQNTLTNPVTSNGSLTTNRIPKVVGVNQLGNSNISDTGALVTVSSPLNSTGLITGSSGIVYTRAMYYGGSDMNDLGDAGFYSASTSNPTTNLPSSGAFYVSVERSSVDGTNCVQTAVSNGFSNTPNRKYSRTKVNNVWGTWREIAYLDNTSFTGTTNAALLNLSGTPDTNATSTHYFVENANIPGAVQPKTLANARAELVTSAAVVAGLGYTPSNDADVLHKTGNETKNGSLTILGGTNSTGSINSGISQEGEFTGITSLSQEQTSFGGKLYFKGRLTLTSYNDTDNTTNSAIITVPNSLGSEVVLTIPDKAGTIALTSDLIKNGTITTSTSITNTTLTSDSLPQDGKTILISNGASNINYTVNGSITASFVKGGTGTITFVQGSGRTLIGANGSLVFNGAQYSTASIVSFGTTDILYLNNF